MPITFGGAGSGAGFRLGPVSNIFGFTAGDANASPLVVVAASTKAVAEGVRDTYFAANASNLAQYDAEGSESLGILIYFLDGSENVIQPQTRIGGAWRDNAAIVAIQGASGVDGTLLEFSNETERDEFFSNRLDMLRSQLPILVTVGVETVSSQVWNGVTNPTVYNGDLWGVASIRSGTASFELAAVHTISSGGHNIFVTNESSDLSFFPVWQFLGDHRTVPGRVVNDIPTSRQYNPTGNNPPLSIEPGGARATAGTTPFNVDFTILNFSTSLFGLTYVPLETYSGVIRYQVTDRDTNIILFNQSETVSFTAGTEHAQWFQFPFEALNNENLNARLLKEDLTVLNVRPEALNANRPYTTSHVRSFTDDPILVSTHAAEQLTPVIVAGANVTVTADNSANTLTVAAAAGGENNVQSDWDETDSNDMSFIQNKPTIPTPRTDEEIFNVFADSIVGGNHITITRDDANNRITVAVTGSVTPPPVQGPTSLLYGLSDADDPATVDTGTFTNINSTSPQTVSTGLTTANQYFIILVANTHDISRIRDTVLEQVVTDIFVKTDDVRTLNTITYDSYVIGPLNAGLNEEYVLEF